MASVEKIILQMRDNPKNVRFSDLYKVCIELFGQPRQEKSSHIVFRTPWQGDPRINIQPRDKTAKPYQVKQVLAAVDKFEEQKNVAV